MWLVAFLFFFFFLALDCPRKTDAATLHRVMMIKEELRFFFFFFFFLKKKIVVPGEARCADPDPMCWGPDK